MESWTRGRLHRLVRCWQLRLTSNPCRENEADGNRPRKYDRHNKEIFVTQKRHDDEADRQAPGNERHRRQRFSGQTSNLPRDHSRKKQKDGHEEPESSEEVPVGPTESLNVEMGRA